MNYNPNKKAQIWIIKDWAGNDIRFKNRPHEFTCFENAEDVLLEELGDDYETDRQEYEIIRIY